MVSWAQMYSSQAGPLLMIWTEALATTGQNQESKHHTHAHSLVNEMADVWFLSQVAS